jgi:hypothetical protein
LAKVIYRGWFLWLFVPLTVLLAGARWKMSRGAPPSSAWRDAAPAGPILPATLVLAVSFYLGLVSLLIAAASYADSRLVVPAAVFVPSLLLLLLIRELGLLRAAARLRRGERAI